MLNLAKMIGELNECLFKLRQPLECFLCEILPPLININQWENKVFGELEQNEYCKKVIKKNNMKSFQDLDISLLLDVFLLFFDRLKYFYNSLQESKYLKYFGKFDDRFLVVTIKENRRLIAHPNDNTLNIEIMKNILDDFIKFGNYIEMDKEKIRSIQIIKSKYTKYQNNTIAEQEKNDRIKFIEDNIIRDALNKEELDDDIKDSVLTTLFRLKIKRTSKEIDSFFIGAQDASSRGQEIKEALHKNGLRAFEDFRKEYEENFMKDGFNGT